MDNLIAFQDAVDRFMDAWNARLNAFIDHPLGTPPPTLETFVQLNAAQTQVRTTAARTGDRALIAEIPALTPLMRAVAAPELAVPTLGSDAGRLSARLIFGASEMINRNLTWEEAVDDMIPDDPGWRQPKFFPGKLRGCRAW